VRGAAAVNLATGKGLLTGGGASSVTLATTPDRLVLDQAGFRGALTVGTGRQGISGSVRGTGRVTLTGAGSWTDQLWYMGYIAQGTDYNIWSGLDSEVVDVQNAYPYAGGYVDQWPHNGGSNQTFWLTSSTN